MKIVISGFTAAGKTTHGKLIADQFQIPFYEATEVFARFSPASTFSEHDRRWNPEVDRARVLNPAIDERVDTYLVELLRRSGSGVFDACMLPWLETGPKQLNIWIDSGLISRTNKCLVSHFESNWSPERAKAIILAKDQMTASRLHESCAATYFPDPGKFHIIASNEDLIPVPTPSAAQKGIHQFHSNLLDAINFCFGRAPAVHEASRIIQSRPVE